MLFCFFKGGDFMMDEIFELVLKEARARPGDDLTLNAYYVINDLYKRVFHAFESLPSSSCEFPSTDDETP